MYTLYIRWVMCDPEMNFGAMLVKRYARIETVTYKTCSLEAKLFLRIEKRPEFNQVFLEF